ncbi:hypothetical protein O181_079101, partial [Austropuccinia psidii MF-1]|nr:hypothetical protein [Austropuccinia psidii MF-1]
VHTSISSNELSSLAIAPSHCFQSGATLASFKFSGILISVLVEKKSPTVILESNEFAHPPPVFQFAPFFS